MAGSYNHLRGRTDGNPDLDMVCENMGDAKECINECWHIIRILSNGSDTAVQEAIIQMNGESKDGKIDLMFNGEQF